MQSLPAGAPNTMNEAFAYIASLDSPSVDDLKLMVMLEALGKDLYDDMASGVEDEGVRALLHKNGREELAHAHRVSRAIGAMTGTDYPVPERDENPLLAEAQKPRGVTRDMLLALAQSEFGGEALYERWASHCDNGEAAALFRQNGREEAGHGARLQQAAALLPA